MEQSDYRTKPDQITRRFDPHLYQIASLSTLLLYGLLWLRFDVSLLQIAVTIGRALLTQYVRNAILPSAIVRSSQSAHLSPVPLPAAPNQ